MKSTLYDRAANDASSSCLNIRLQSLLSKMLHIVSIEGVTFHCAFHEAWRVKYTQSRGPLKASDLNRNSHFAHTE